jgi:glycerophosphoryl diester phosphodiesterase
MTANAVGQIINPIVLLSFSQEAVRVIHEQSSHTTGWVLDSFNDEHRDHAKALRPDFLFCNKDKIDAALWPGMWKWIIYEVESLDTALEWMTRGAHFIESMWPGELMTAALIGDELC